MFLDGYAHSEILEGSEGFITPWHAIFYAGFLAVLSWVVWLGSRAIDKERGFLNAVPHGYELTVVGIGVFAAGGVGDAIWHTLYGVENSIDALLSPTHLLLYVGMLLIVTTPFRSALHRSTGALDWRGFRAPFVSVLLASALVAFFFVYLWGPSDPFWYRQFYNPIDDAGNQYVTAGIGSVLVSTAVLVAPVLVVVRRWTPPFGFVTLLWPIVNALVAVAFDRELAGVWAGLVAGLLVDAILLVFRGRPRYSGPVAGFAGPLALWTVFFFLIGRDEPLRWQPELWGGAIFFAGLLGLAMALFSGGDAGRRTDSGAASSPR